MPKTREIGKNLLKKGQTWMVTLRVREDLKDKFGVSRLKKILKTTDLASAERRKVPLLAHWRLLFELARENPDAVISDIDQTSEIYRNYLLRLYERPGMWDSYVEFCAKAWKARKDAQRQREKERQEMIEILTWIFIIVVVWGGLDYGAYYWFTK